MKKSVFLLCALALVVFACDKDKDNNNNSDGSSVLLLDRIYEFGDLLNIEGDSAVFCQFEYDNQNRVRKITYDGDDTDYAAFSYDNNGRLASVKYYGEYTGGVTLQIQYTGNKVTLVEENEDSDYTYSYVITLNNEGLPVTIAETVSSDSEYHGDDYQLWTLTYDGKGNIIRLDEDRTSNIGTDDEETCKGKVIYTYDDKKSPFYSCNLPLWFWVWDYSFYWEAAYYGCGVNNFAKIEAFDVDDDNRLLSTNNYTSKYNKDGYLSKSTYKKSGSYGREDAAFSFHYTKTK